MKIEKNKMLKNKRNELKMNVKPKFFKVMKQKIFTLMMMLALVIVTSSAFAQGNSSPYIGGTYHYTLGLTLTGAANPAVVATASFSYTPSATGVTLPGSKNLTVDSTLIHFDVSYATGAGDGDLTVTVTYAGAGGCSNSISMAITPQPRPTFVLGVAADDVTACQEYPDGTETTVTYTVTPTTTAIGYTYTYTLAFSPADINGSSYTLSATDGVDNGDGTITVTDAAAGPSVVTVTFNSAAGAAVSLVADLAPTPVMTLADAEGGGTVNGGANSPDTGTTTIGKMPILGAFN
jgi:hypothetical protein